MDLKELTKQELAILHISILIRDAIKEAGPTGIPSGVVYSAVMGTLSLDQYTAIISALKKAEVIEELPLHILRFTQEPPSAEAKEE